MRYLLLLFLGVSLFAQVLTEGESQGMKYKVEKLTDALRIPWGMDFLNEKEMIISQKNGKVFILHVENGNTKEIGVEVPDLLVVGQGGLMDVAVHENGWIYFTYVKDSNGQGETTLARAKLKDEKLTEWEDLFVSDSATSTGRHFGSRIAFDEKGYLYFGIGDRGVRPNSQDKSNDAGSILRLHLDGDIPKDNPFGDAIYSYGHRNPQGLFYNDTSKRLISNEHGPRGGDEINVIKKGANYGWPVISYGKEYWGPVAVGESTHKEGMEQPLHQFTPSIAPSSLIIYQGDAFPKWRGNIFSGALVLTHLNRLVVDEKDNILHEERLLKSLNQRIRNVKEGPDGFLYIASDSGWIMKISPQRE